MERFPRERGRGHEEYARELWGLRCDFLKERQTTTFALIHNNPDVHWRHAEDGRLTLNLGASSPTSASRRPAGRLPTHESGPSRDGASRARETNREDDPARRPFGRPLRERHGSGERYGAVGHGSTATTILTCSRCCPSSRSKRRPPFGAVVGAVLPAAFPLDSRGHDVKAMLRAVVVYADFVRRAEKVVELGIDARVLALEPALRLPSSAPPPQPRNAIRGAACRSRAGSRGARAAVGLSA
jgi:hypothetical protein